MVSRIDTQQTLNSYRLSWFRRCAIVAWPPYCVVHLHLLLLERLAQSR